MGGITVYGVTAEGEEWPADNYEKIVLLAREQPYTFNERVKAFLSRNAGFVSDHVYHLGPSTVLHRIDAPLSLEDKDLVNIALYLTARTKSELEETMAMITEQRKEFWVFEPFPASPDPLIQTAINS